jgi:type IV pilus assembly protein PilC
MPKFTPLFRSRGTELPAPTKVMMAVSDAMINHWQWWIAGAGLLAVSLAYLRRTEVGRRLLDWLRINSPIIGPMYRKVIISRSIRTLGTMVANGVPIMDAIRMAGDVAGNWYYQRAWGEVLEQVAAGKRICEVLRGNPLFPHVLVQMISSGEESGRLDHVLERVSTYYDSEVEVAVKAATSLIEPLMIAAMGVIVGTIGLALLLPIFSLSRQP